MSEIRGESLFVPVGREGDRLHLRRFRGGGAPVLMLHGSVENGRIFYSTSGKGLGPYLARLGYDVFVADLRGRGESQPHVSRRAVYGQTEAITEDLPTLADAVAARTDGRPQHWVAHSWGGVLAASHLVRFPERGRRVASLTCFGTKRSIAVGGLGKAWTVDLVWNRVGRVAAAAFGYLPSRVLRFGSDDEPRRYHEDVVKWVDPRAPWVDPQDGFDYGAAARRVQLPRTLHFAGAADPFLGHPEDVRRFMAECGTPPGSLRLLAVATGHHRDYGHIDMLTHPACPEDHFPEVVAWLGPSGLGL